jgi:multiple antibiotic resistance protein
MNDIWFFSVTVFAGFFAIMNPIANIPIFIGLTAGVDKKTRNKVSKSATFTAFVIITIFVLLGKYIFELFGLTIPAFKITGGILVFFVGFEMLQSKVSSIQHQKDIHFDEGISISPLATPILAGPGTIVTAMNFTAEASYLYIAIIIFIALTMCIVTHIAFVSSEHLLKIVGSNKIRVIGKLMGLIIAVIGTNMILEGIKLQFF